MTDYHYRSLLICTDKEAGNALANMAASFINDPGAEAETFTDARMVALATAPTVPVAWYVDMPSKSTLAGAIEALKAGAGYDDARLDYLKESPRNLSPGQWAAAAAIFPCRDVYDTLVGGYQSDAMSNLAAANGYVIVEPVEDQP